MGQKSIIDFYGNFVKKKADERFHAGDKDSILDNCGLTLVAPLHNLRYIDTSFVFTTRLPDTCPSSGQSIIKHLSYDYSETSMVQHHRDLRISFVGLPTRLATRGLIVIDSLMVKKKDVSEAAKLFFNEKQVLNCLKSNVFFK